MLELPYMQEILQEVVAERVQQVVAERMHRVILGILEDRFGTVPAEVVQALEAITDDDRLQTLAKLAARCPDLMTFHAQLSS